MPQMPHDLRRTCSAAGGGRPGISALVLSDMAVPSFKCLSFMRHSIAIHNEAAAAHHADAMDSVYLNEAYADAR